MVRAIAIFAFQGAANAMFCTMAQEYAH